MKIRVLCLVIVSIIVILGIFYAQAQAVLIHCPNGIAVATPVGNDMNVFCVPNTATPVGSATPTPTNTNTPTITPTPTTAPTATPTPVGALSLNEPHPDAGLWVAYYGDNTVTDLQSSRVQGVMVYSHWEDLWTSTICCTWTNFLDELDFVVNQAGKKAFTVVTAGYCPDLDWPQAIKDQIAHRTAASSMGCQPPQFWDPNYLALYQDYIAELADTLAAFDSTDDRPTVTDVVFVRAAEMGETTETMASPDALSNWQWTDFTAAPNGRLYQVDLTDTLQHDYYQDMLATYRSELNRAYSAVGLIPPEPVANSGSSYWGTTRSTQYIFDNLYWMDSHNTDPNTRSSYYDFYVGTQLNLGRVAVESGGWWGQSSTWLAEYAYWEMLNNLHHGVEFLGVFGTVNAHPATLPKGFVTWDPTVETWDFANTYAGQMRDPAGAPGVWIALRGYYFEDRFSSVYMKRWLGNYEGGILQTNHANSTALFGLAHTMEEAMINPVVARVDGHVWSTDNTSCLSKYTVHACEGAAQPPTVQIENHSNGKEQFVYPVTNLGTVRWCGTDMFCVGGTATRTETMPWARETDGVPMTFDVNNAFATSLTGPVDIVVTYLDEGTDQWRLTVDGSIRHTQTNVNSNLWKQVTVLNVPAGALDIELQPLSDGDNIFHLIEVRR